MADAKNTALTSSIAAGTNIKFLNGSQSNLNTLLTNGTATEGAFYLTSDTHRLYIGQKEASNSTRVIPVPVNQGVTTVETVKDLTAEAGAFYYVESENIFCVYNGKEWVQINPDTNTYVSDVAVTVATTNGKATITTTVTQQGNGTNGSGQKLTTSASISGANGIVVSSSGKDITVTGDTYTLSSDEDKTNGTVTVKLDSTNTTNDSSVTFKPGDDNLTVKKDESGNVVITSKNTGLQTVTGGAGKSATDTGKDGFYVTVTDSEGKSGTATLNPGITINDKTSYFKNGTVTLDVYDKSEIQDLFKALDAVIYKGLLTSAPSNTGRGNGELYLISGSDSITITNGDGSTFRAFPGDTIISRGTETDGVISADSIIWDYIPSGNDVVVDSTYTGVAVDKGVSIKGVTGDDAGSVIAKLAVNADETYLTASDNKSTNGKENVVTITHKEIQKNDGTFNDDSTATAKTNERTFSIVSGLTRDAAGHVTGVTTQEITTDISNVNSVTYAASATGNVATVTNTVVTRTASGTNTSKSGSFTVGSSTLNVTATGSAVTMDLVWDSF